MMILTLSCDHRVTDGARAAQFLACLAEAMRDPAKLLK
jgi:pyruvate/2-oxoglutarate dehydrogenase complex dihydrolipoamide acyltransferase (E2) component